MDLELHQMDDKTTFLNGELDEEIYIKRPEGYITKDHDHKICRLKRSIYMLKLRFHESVMTYGFSMTKEDYCVYVKRFKGNLVILSLYVDGILLAGNNIEFV